MLQRTEKRIAHAVATLAAAILLSACNRDAGREALAAPQPAAQLAGGETAAPRDAAARHAVIERRHFDAYKHFRRLSERPEDAAPSDFGDDDEGLQRALLTVRGTNLELLPACSMRTLLTAY